MFECATADCDLLNLVLRCLDLMNDLNVVLVLCMLHHSQTHLALVCLSHKHSDAPSTEQV